LHKTFSTPHGGGGPGSGPVVLSEALAPYGPLPFVAKYPDGSFKIVEEESAGQEHPRAFGRMVAFHGQMGMFTRALAYILSHGAMLIEPTETESKASLDQFIMAVRSIAKRAKTGDQSLKAAPVHAPRRRLDETLAARKPVLTYREPEAAQAAE